MGTIEKIAEIGNSFGSLAPGGLKKGAALYLIVEAIKALAVTTALAPGAQVAAIAAVGAVGLGYMVGQGLADFGKSGAKLSAQEAAAGAGDSAVAGFAEH